MPHTRTTRAVRLAACAASPSGCVFGPPHAPAHVADGISDGVAPARRPKALEALVDCARAGDSRAFRQVTERLAPQLVRFVSGYLRGDVHTANDVVQDTFVTAWHKLDQIRDGGHLRPWLYKVARYKAISWLRRRGPRGTPMESIDCAVERGAELPEQSQLSPLRGAMSAEPRDPWLVALRDCLERLPPLYLGVVRLHYMHGHTAGEVADLLGLARTTVKMRLLRARKILKRMVLESVEARRGT